MNLKDDAALAAQLGRRSTATPDSASSPIAEARARRLAISIAARVGQAHQERVHPWTGFGRTPALIPGQSRLPVAAGGAVALVVVLALASGLLTLSTSKPLGSPAPSPQTAWFLTTAQLQRVVAGTATSSENIGKTIIANVQITDLARSCPAANSCGYDTIIAGAEPHIPVTDAEISPLCPAPVGPAGSPSCPTGLPPSGPTALTIENRSVKFAASVEINQNDPRPSTVEQFLQGSPTSPIVVDSWLSRAGELPGCPAPQPGTSYGPFACGEASWLTDSPFISTVPDGTNGWDTGGPSTGIRVQNGAYSTFAPSQTATDTNGFPASQRALYLAARDYSPGSDCFMCSSGAATLIARIEPVTIPPSVMPSPSDSSPSSTPGPVSATPWHLTAAQLQDAVAGATAQDSGVGRVVVAQVQFEKAAGCEPSFTPPGCAVVVSGSDPPIPLVGAPSWNCPMGNLCPIQVFPVAPVGSAAALQIDRDGSVVWIGAVAADGRPWTFAQLQHLLTGLHRGDAEANELYPVEAWISGAQSAMRCPPPESSDARLFGCDWSWLTSGPVWPNEVTTSGWGVTAPTDGIELQGGAWGPYGAKSGLNASGSANPVAGVFLVQPYLDSGPQCSGCGHGPRAILVSGLDPEIEPDAFSVSAPSVSADARELLPTPAPR